MTVEHVHVHYSGCLHDPNHTENPESCEGCDTVAATFFTTKLVTESVFKPVKGHWPCRYCEDYGCSHCHENCGSECPDVKLAMEPVGLHKTMLEARELVDKQPAYLKQVSPVVRPATEKENEDD